MAVVIRSKYDVNCVHTEANVIKSLDRKSYPFPLFFGIFIHFICRVFCLFIVSGCRCRCAATAEVVVAAAAAGSVVLITITFYGVLYKCDDCVTRQEDEIGYVDFRLNKFSFLVLSV